MSINTLYNFSIDSPTQITDELYNSVGASTFQLGTVKRAFKGSTDMVIRTAASGGGTLLVEDTDYTLENEDFDLTADCGYTVYTGVNVIEGDYQACDLYITYKVVGSYTDVASIIDLTGCIFPFSGTTVPSGFLLCDGSSLLRATYSAYWAAVGLSKGTCTISIASPGVVTLNTHGLLTGECISLTTTGALPTGLSVSTNYYVIKNDADTFWLATTLANAIAGTKINTSGAQNGDHTLTFNPWGIADATHCNLPDLRGVELEGAGLQANAAWAAAEYTGIMGAYLQDKFQGHYHNLLVDDNNSNTGVSNNVYLCNATNGGAAYWRTEYAYNNTVSITEAITDSINGTPRTGAATKSPRVGVNFIVKV